MPVIVYIDALVLGIYAMGLCWVNLCVAIFLTRKHQSTVPHHLLESTYKPTRDEAPPLSGLAHAIGVVPPRIFSDEVAVANQSEPLADQWQLPVQPGTPDQVVIHIEPDGLPTEGQKNIRRIIEHLQKMPSTASSPEIAS